MLSTFEPQTHNHKHDCNECVVQHANLNSLAVYLQSLHGEVHTDRVPLFLDEYTGLEALHHAGFTDTDISDQNYLED